MGVSSDIIHMGRHDFSNIVASSEGIVEKDTKREDIIL
jgi:hypothetical protein